MTSFSDGDPSSPEPDRPAEGRSRLRRAASTLGGALGCLALPVMLLTAVVLALGVVVGDPTFWIAVAALVVAVSAYTSSTRRR